MESWTSTTVHDYETGIVVRTGEGTPPYYRFSAKAVLARLEAAEAYIANRRHQMPALTLRQRIVNGTPWYDLKWTRPKALHQPNVAWSQYGQLDPADDDVILLYRKHRVTGSIQLIDLRYVPDYSTEDLYRRLRPIWRYRAGISLKVVRALLRCGGATAIFVSWYEAFLKHHAKPHIRWQFLHFKEGMSPIPALY